MELNKSGGRRRHIVLSRPATDAPFVHSGPIVVAVTRAS